LALRANRVRLAFDNYVLDIARRELRADGGRTAGLRPIGRIPVRMTAMGRLLPAALEAASVRYRRNLAAHQGVDEGRLSTPILAAWNARRDRVSWRKSDIGTRFLRELSDCFGHTGTESMWGNRVVELAAPHFRQRSGLPVANKHA
jgi:hypothetical protein